MDQVTGASAAEARSALALTGNDVAAAVQRLKLDKLAR
jgi:NACalpha-BTF3-like transcription factor